MGRGDLVCFPGSDAPVQLRKRAQVNVFVLKFNLLSVQKGTGSQVLGSWNKAARVNSCFYRILEAAVVAMTNCVVRACSALTPSVVLGMHNKGTSALTLSVLWSMGLGACLYSSLLLLIFQCKIFRYTYQIFTRRALHVLRVSSVKGVETRFKFLPSTKSSFSSSVIVLRLFLWGIRL